MFALFVGCWVVPTMLAAVMFRVHVLLVHVPFQFFAPRVLLFMFQVFVVLFQFKVQVSWAWFAFSLKSLVGMFGVVPSVLAYRYRL